MIRPGLLSWFVVLIGLPGMFWSAANGAADPAPSTAILKGDSVAQVFSKFHRTERVAVLVQEPMVGRKVEADVGSATPERALEAASRDLHLLVRRRPASVACVPRFGTARERSDLEISCMAEITAGMHRLVHALSPPPLDVAAIRRQNTFHRTLTANQVAAMRDKRLPFEQLTPEQRTLWLLINKTQAYGNWNLEMGREREIFGNWDKTFLEWTFAEERPVLWFAYPSTEPGTQNGIARFELPVGEAREQAERSEPRVELLPADQRRHPEAFRNRVAHPDGPTTLGRLVNSLEAATRRNIRVPEYAAERKLLAYTSGNSAAEVIQGLGDLYGWMLQSQEGSRYFLGPVRYGAAAHHADLHEKLRATLPPAAQQLWNVEGNEFAVNRYAYHFSGILGEIPRMKGANWKRVRTGELDPHLSRRLANVVFDRYVRTVATDLLLTSSAKWWAIAPERGYFRLEEEGEHPLLRFCVERPDGNLDTWGWFVGTSTLKD